MIINEKKPTIESSEEMKSMMFGVGDLGMLFNILRSKLYSNPVQVICREISCNARDAHREVGSGNKPIQITLPNALEPNLRIKDWGPGISPDRVANIFVNFGASTKRSSNEQTGGWGLGGKSFFAYTDCAVIETIYDGIKYCYSCVIDETKIGKCMEISRTKTKDPNGTEVIIPIKPNDFKAFAEAVEYTTRYFDPRPIIKGGKINYQEMKPIISGNDWALCPSSGYDVSCRLIIDGVEYPLVHTSLKDWQNLKLLQSHNYQVLLHFKTGELSLSASREAVHLDDETEAKITKRLIVSYNEIREQIQSKIDKSTTFLEANNAYTGLHSTLPAITKPMNLKWNGKALYTVMSFYGCDKWIKGSTFGSNPGIHFGNLTKLPTIYINDLPIDSKADYGYATLNREVLNSFFENIKETSAYIISTDPVSLEKYTKQFSLDQYDLKKLSDHIKIKEKKEYIPRITIFKLKDDNDSSSKFLRVKYQDYKSDTNEKVICLLKKDRYSNVRTTILNGKTISSHNIAALTGDKKVSIYGIDEKIKNDVKAKVKKETVLTKLDLKEKKPAKKEDKIKVLFKGAKTLEEYVKECYDETNVDYAKIKAISAILGDVSYGSIFNNFDTFDSRTNATITKCLTDKNSILFKGLQKMQELNRFKNDNWNKLVAYETMVKPISETEVKDWRKKNEDDDLMHMSKVISQRYPLLAYLNSYSVKIEEVCDYINLVEQVKGKDIDNKNNKETNNGK
jgi:hypothetical protein